MAIPPFPFWKTFVAFMDIMGFKSMMVDEQRALLALDALYSAGFRVLRDQGADQGPRVDGIFVSDCGILFVRGGSNTMHLLASCHSVGLFVRYSGGRLETPSN